MDKYNDVTQFKTAGFFRRLFARIVDNSLGFIVVLLLFALIGKSMSDSVSMVLMSGQPNYRVIAALVAAGLISLLLSTLVMFFYSWIFTFKFGGTLGKLLFGLRILNEEGGYMDKRKAFWRMTAGYSASAVFMYLGYFWVFRKKENLAWHDRFFGTRVVRIGKPIAGVISLIVFPISAIFIITQLIVPMVSLAL